MSRGHTRNARRSAPRLRYGTPEEGGEVVVWHGNVSACGIVEGWRAATPRLQSAHDSSGKNAI